jgi:hypothetical protein
MSNVRAAIHRSALRVAVELQKRCGFLAEALEGQPLFPAGILCESRPVEPLACPVRLAVSVARHRDEELCPVRAALAVQLDRLFEGLDRSAYRLGNCAAPRSASTSAVRWPFALPCPKSGSFTVALQPVAAPAKVARAAAGLTAYPCGLLPSYDLDPVAAGPRGSAAREWAGPCRGATRTPAATPGRPGRVAGGAPAVATSTAADARGAGATR